MWFLKAAKWIMLCFIQYVGIFHEILHGVREHRAERIPHLMKEWTNAFGLGFNVGVNRFKGLAARMLLILFLEFTTTFRTLPHRNSLLPFRYREFNAVTGLPSDSRPNILSHVDNVADGTLGILRAHFISLPSYSSPSKVTWTLTLPVQNFPCYHMEIR